MNQSESFVDFFRPWYDCQSSIDIKFINYSGNVYCDISTFHKQLQIIRTTGHRYKECVAVSINICPWQKPIQLCNKARITCCLIPGCTWVVNFVQQSSISRSFSDLHFVWESIGFLHTSPCMVYCYVFPPMGTAILLIQIQVIQMPTHPLYNGRCPGVGTQWSRSKKMILFISMNRWRHLFHNVMYFPEILKLRHCFLFRANQTVTRKILSTYKTAPLFLYKPIILATHSYLLTTMLCFFTVCILVIEFEWSRLPSLKRWTGWNFLKVLSLDKYTWGWHP